MRQDTTTVDAAGSGNVVDGGNLDRLYAEEHIGQFFKYDHLPPQLRAVSRPFCALAVDVVCNLPRNPERTVALRKLLEAKDAAVRAVVAT